MFLVVRRIRQTLLEASAFRRYLLYAQGEILQIKDVINTMVDQLSSFADEVTRVAREVGAEGKLGGQARVGGVAGMWKGLTRRGDSMAGKRTVLPNCRVLIHQPWVRNLGGQQSDIQIHAEDLLRLRATLDELLAKHTGKSVEQIHRDTDRDHILTAQEAIDYGLADQIMARRELPEGEGDRRR